MASISKMVREAGNCVRCPYYTGPFEFFEDILVRGVEWDIKPTLRVLPPAPGRLLEIGAGRGRVTIPMINAGYNVVAIDKSLGSIESLSFRFEQAGLSHRATAICSDLNKYESQDRFDIAVLANLSINLFIPSEVRSLLKRLRRLLKVGASFCFGVFDAASLPAFQRHDGTVDNSFHVQAYEDQENVVRLMFMSTLYDAATHNLYQNWFVDLHGSKVHPERFYVASLSEHLWTTEDLLPELNESGFVIRNIEHGEITGGGASGLRVLFLNCVVE